MTGNDQLFEELRRLVSPTHREPPDESVAALHTAVARQFSGTRKRPWWRQKITVGAAVFGLAAGAPSAAFGLGAASLPDPIRTAMYDIGLPVDSVQVADTKDAEADLEKALRVRSQADIRRAASNLQTCLAELDPFDRARLGPRAASLLQTAASLSDRDDGHPDASTEQLEPNGSAGTDGDHQTVGGTGTTPISGSGSGSGSDGSTQVNGDVATSGSGGTSDGDRTTSTTLAPLPNQTNGGSTTPTTVQSGSGDGGSGSSDGGDGGSTSSGTVEQSH